MKKNLLLLLLFVSSVQFSHATTCAGAQLIPGLPGMPYSQSLVCGATDDINSANATACGSSFYLGGQESVYAWTPSANYSGVTIAYNGVSWSGIMLYAGCPTSGGTCVANITSSATSKTLTVPGLLTAGVTYYIVFDTWPTPNSPCPGTFTLNGTAVLPAAPPTPVQDPAVPTCTAGSSISITGTPVAHTAWFWQATATGTSLATISNGPHVVFTNGTYYARTYDSVSTQWSATSSSITITNFPAATAPPAAVAAQNPACATTGTTLSEVVAPAGYVYYWQGNVNGGTSMASDASTPYTVNATDTYYVAAYETATGCWSNAVGTAVTIQSYIPAVPTATDYTVCLGTPSQMIVATPPPGGSGGNISQSFGTNLVSTGTGAATFDITIPVVPADATITSAQLQFTNVNSINGSWRSEIRVGLSGVYNLSPTQISTQSSGGLISPDPVVNLAGFVSAGGTLTLSLTESYDDFGVDDASFGEVKLVVTYTQNPVSNLTWYTAPSAGAVLGTTASIEAVGTPVLPTTNTVGTYTFYAESNSGVCISATRLPVNVNVTQVTAVATSAAITCNGNNDGTASVTATGGSGLMTYDWLPGTPDGDGTNALTDLAAGTYTVNITDANSCAASATVVVTEPSAIMIMPASQSDVSCNGGSNGAAAIMAMGGTGILSYAWTTAPAGDGTSAVNGLSAGTYTVTVSDANSCSNTSTVTITEPPALAISPASATNVTCFGGSNGTASVTGSGGTGMLSYSWTSAPAGDGTDTVSGLSAGTYSVTVTDINGCTATTTTDITEASQILVAPSSETDATCHGASNGAANITASGGTGMLSYDWTPGAPTGDGSASITSIPAGNWTVHVTDGNGCADSTTITVSEPAAITSSQAPVVCAGGSVTVGANTYNASGVYTDVYTAYNGCDSTFTTNLTVNPPVDVTISQIGYTLTANAAGANYQWLYCVETGNTAISGETNQNYNVFVSGNYAVMVDQAGCVDTSACEFVLVEGINAIAADNTFDVYPNPATQNVTIEMGADLLQNTKTVNIYNTLGKLVYSQQIVALKTEINIDGLAKGIYIVKVETGNGTLTKRIVKE